MKSTKSANPHCMHKCTVYLCYDATAYMYYTHHHHHHVKCWRFHSAAEALVTAYSKEISNESCREASKTIVMKNHSVLRA